MNLNKYFNTAKHVLPHAVFILSGLFMVFMILDEYNPTKQFVVRGVSIGMLWGFCILAATNAILTITDQRNRK